MINIWAIKGVVKIMGTALMGSVLMQQTAAQGLPAMDSGLSPNTISLISLIVGPLAGTVLAYLTMRRMISKDRDERANKESDKAQQQDALIHGSIVDITSISADERKDARAVLLEVIQSLRQERDHMQDFYTAQLKEKQSTIELQRSFIKDIETVKVSVDTLAQVANKLEIIAVSLTAAKLPSP